MCENRQLHRAGRRASTRFGTGRFLAAEFERDLWEGDNIALTHYVWGADLSGTIHGAGGVGGLLAAKRDGVWYAPLYDANGHQKSAKPKGNPPGDRDFIAVPKGQSEERYPATQRQLYVTAYVSENGSIVAEYEYDAFGATVSQSGALSDAFRHRFSTKPWIAALGAYDYGERVYSPGLRRWLSRDPIEEEGGLNLYAMCGNDAVNSVDPDGRTKYWDNYMNFADYKDSGKVWKKVGGNLYWGYLTSLYYNSCALRVSRTIILNGHNPKSGEDRNMNKDYVTLKEIQAPDGVLIPKGTMLKAESNGKRYVISAHAIGKLLDECLTAPNVKKLNWKSAEEANRIRDCIEEEDGEAFFAANGHAGMIKKGYRDANFPYRSTGRIWRLK